MTTTTTTNKKSVSFSPRRENIDSLEEEGTNMLLTQEERDSVWYSKKDLSEILTRCKVLASNCQQQVGGNITLDDDDSIDETERGLETLLSSSSRLMKRKRAIRQVLKEQSRLRSVTGKSLVDPEALAAIERTTSEHRLRIAQLQASKDAQAVNNMIDNHSSFFSSSSSSSSPYSSSSPDKKWQQDHEQIKGYYAFARSLESVDKINDVKKKKYGDINHPLLIRPCSSSSSSAKDFGVLARREERRLKKRRVRSERRLLRAAAPVVVGTTNTYPTN